MNGVNALISLGALLLLGLGAPAQAQGGNYVGHVPGSDAFVAIVTDGDEVLAFVCDGVRLVVWLQGVMADDGSFTIRSATDYPSRTYTLEARLDSAGARGAFTLGDGQQLDFSAGTTEGESGLYRAEKTIDGVDYVGGWIVDQNGEQRGSVIGGTAFRSASRLDVVTLQAEVRGLGMFNPKRVTPALVASTVRP